MRKLFEITTITALTLLFTISIRLVCTACTMPNYELVPIELSTEMESYIPALASPSQPIEIAAIEEVKEIESEEVLPNKDIELIALVTMAEAEGECEMGKRLVIDTILNRVDSKYFPDSVHDVIYQPNQFTSMWTSRIKRCEVREDICQLVREELKGRTNREVIFFTAGKYSVYGVPMFQVENHYFSRYE